MSSGVDMQGATVPSESLRILLVEDVAADADLVVHELERAGLVFTSRRVQSEPELRDALRRFEPHLVLSDHSLPQLTALDTLHLVQRVCPHTPLIIVTGSLDEETAAAYIKSGAVDYVVKTRLVRLGPAVQRALALRQAVAEAAQAEADRVRSEQRFRRLVEHSSDVITLLDAAGRILYSTQSLKPTLGYAPGEKVGHNVLELLRLEDRGPAELWLRALVERPDDPLRMELQVQHKNGSWRRLDVVATNHLADPVVSALVVNYHDITDRHIAQAALAESEARFRKLTETSFDGFHITVEGVLREANRGFAEMFGYTLEEVIGRPVTDFVVDESVGQGRERVAAGAEGTCELVGRRKDGSRILLEVTARNHVFGGRPGRISALRDVTEQRLLETQIRQAQKMEAIGRLASGVAHDFNNLLTAILGSTELLLEALPADHPGREDALETRKAALGAADLTRQLLAFSREQVLTPRILNLNAVVADMDRMLQRLIGADVTLRTVLADAPGAIRADPGQLEQVVVNLAVNARDAMPGGGTLTIETANVELDASCTAGHPEIQPGPFVMLAVSDTGSGMDAQTQSRAFEPFFTTKAPGKGTGLGLATVYGIVKQSGGSIWLHSEVGQGTTFKIYLPRVAAPVPSTGSSAAPADDLDGVESVLVVDDQAQVRRLTGRLLEARGYTVYQAPDGATALRVAQELDGRIDLLVTDLVMPGMSGVELGLLLPQAHPHIAVLYLSGHTDESVLPYGILDRGRAFLQKPFTAEGLARKVREVLDSRDPS